MRFIYNLIGALYTVTQCIQHCPGVTGYTYFGEGVPVNVETGQYKYMETYTLNWDNAQDMNIRFVDVVANMCEETGPNCLGFALHPNDGCRRYEFLLIYDDFTKVETNPKARSLSNPYVTLKWIPDPRDRHTFYAIGKPHPRVTSAISGKGWHKWHSYLKNE